MILQSERENISVLMPTWLLKVGPRVPFAVSIETKPSEKQQFQYSASFLATIVSAISEKWLDFHSLPIKTRT